MGLSFFFLEESFDLQNAPPSQLAPQQLLPPHPFSFLNLLSCLFSSFPHWQAADKARGYLFSSLPAEGRAPADPHGSHKIRAGLLITVVLLGRCKRPPAPLRPSHPAGPTPPPTASVRLGPGAPCFRSNKACTKIVQGLYEACRLHGSCISSDARP